MRYFCDCDQPDMKRSIPLSRVSHWCNDFLLTLSRACPHASHMVWGASHFCGITHVSVPFSLLYTSHRTCVQSLLLSLSSCAITRGEAYSNLESAWESHRLLEALNACWVLLAVRNCFGLCSCSLSWRKPFWPSSSPANSLGLLSPTGDCACFAVDESY